MGPDEIAGSIPIFEKKRGEKTPKKVPVKQAPINPVPITTPKARGLAPNPDLVIKSIKKTIIPQAIPKISPVVIPVDNSFKTASFLLLLETRPKAKLLTKTVEHCIPIFPDIPVIKGTKNKTKVKR